MKRLSFTLILVFSGLVSLKAATVSVLVVEAGLPFEPDSSISALAWENGMMDVFFDSGHIVSNVPSYQINDISGLMPSEVNADFQDARETGVDFFVLILLSYSEGSRENPKDVYIRLFRVSNGDLLYEASLPARTWRTSDDEFQDAVRNASRIVSQIR